MYSKALDYEGCLFELRFKVTVNNRSCRQGVLTDAALDQMMQNAASDQSLHCFSP